ncbi:MAG TPA: Zn-dependent oxidoreductase [Acidimicrobiaceae bacterium]|nr:Zn-dependent oxidoreductase [Acidimicrobiaceae bacterium]
MFAVTATSFDAENPLAGLTLGEVPEPEVPDGWALVTLRAAALNHHDIWSLKGVGLRPELLPMILGCDGAGIDADGNEVIIHAVIADPDAGDGDETLDPRRSLLSERFPGTLAERIAVPRRNLIPKPASLTFEQAACLPTSWLTAYRMLFTRAALRPGDTVLVQGAGGGVSTAAIALARAAGLRVWATSRSEEKRARATELGAHATFAPDERLPEKVDAVVETVGRATWASSVRAVRPGGVVVVSGATTGDDPSADLTQVFFLQRSVIGSTMGTRGELQRLVSMVDATGVRPVIDSVRPLADAQSGFAEMLNGDQFGKIVFTI